MTLRPAAVPSEHLDCTTERLLKFALKKSAQLARFFHSLSPSYFLGLGEAEAPFVRLLDFPCGREGEREFMLSTWVG